MMPSIPSLTSNGRTADTAREKAECLNSELAYKSLGEFVIKPRLTFCNQYRRHQPTCPKNLLLCSCSPSLSVLFTLSFAQGHLASAWKSANITALHKKVQKQITATIHQSAFSQSSARLWNPSSIQTLNPSSSPIA